MKISILIVEDHTLLRETLRMLLDNDSRFHVIGECRTGEEAIEAAKKLRPDIIIMDINLPGINGIEATELIRKYLPGARVLALSIHSQPVYAQKIIRSGASGYMTKSSSIKEMV